MLKRAEELAGQKRLQAIRDEYDNRHYTSAKNLGKSYLGAFKDLGSLLATPTRPLPPMTREEERGIPDYVAKTIGDTAKTIGGTAKTTGDVAKTIGGALVDSATDTGRQLYNRPLATSYGLFEKLFKEPAQDALGQVVSAAKAGWKGNWNGGDGLPPDEGLAGFLPREGSASDHLMRAGGNGLLLGSNLAFGTGAFLKKVPKVLEAAAVKSRSPLMTSLTNIVAPGHSNYRLANGVITNPLKVNKGQLVALALGNIGAGAGAGAFRDGDGAGDEFDPSLLGGPPEAPFFQAAQEQQEAIDNASLVQAFTRFRNFKPISGPAYAPAPDEFDPSLLGGPPEAPFFQTAQAQQNAIDDASVDQALTGVRDFKPISGPAYAPAPEPSSPDPVLLQPTTPPPGRSLLPYAGWVAGGLAAGGLLAWTVNHARQKKLEAKKRKYPLAQRYPALYGSR